MSSGPGNSSDELRQWFGQHSVMRWPDDLKFDDRIVWEALPALRRQRRAGSRRWRFSAGALAALLILLWVGVSHLHQPRPTHHPSPARQVAERPATPVTTGVLTQMVMTGLNSGWALTQGDQVLRTNSGGQHWQAVTPPDLPAPAGDLVALAAIGPDVAWVAVDSPHHAVTVERTVTGGRSWSAGRIAPISFGGGGVRMDFISAQVGWIEVSTAGNASPSAALYETTNGGASWHELTVSTSSLAGHLPFGGSIAFTSPTEGIIVGAPRAAGQVPWRYYVAATRDGGRTWSRVTPPEPPSLAGVPSNAIQILTPIVVAKESLVMPVAYTRSDGATTVVIYRQARGHPWAVSGTFTTPAFHGVLHGPNQPLVSFANLRDGWAVVNGRLYRTDSGGQTWSLVTRRSAFTAWTTLRVVSPHAGWSLDTSGVLRDTLNAGATWVRASR
jgi:photosystem II stability/assembly factor-like uncharacterized protein